MSLSHRDFDRHGHTAGLLHITWHPSSRLIVSCGADQRVKVWDISTEQPKATFHKHDGWVYSCTVSHTGGMLASACADQMVRIFDLSTLELLRPEKRGMLGRRLGNRDKESVTFKGPVLSVDFSPEDSWLCVGSSDKNVTLWRVSDGECYQTFDGHSDWVTSVRFSPDGMMILSASYDGTAKVWRVSDSHLAHTLEGHASFVSAAEWGQKGQLIATASGDHSVRLWEAEDGKEVHHLQGHSSWVLDVAFAPREHLLASCGADNVVILWDTRSGTLLSMLRDHTDWVESLSFDPTGNMLATGSHDRNIIVWDVADSSQPHKRLTLHGRRVVPLLSWLYYMLLDLSNWLLNRESAFDDVDILQAAMDDNANNDDPHMAELVANDDEHLAERAMALVRDDVHGIDVQDQVILATMFLKFVGDDDKVPKNAFANACSMDPQLSKLLTLADGKNVTTEQKLRMHENLFIDWTKVLECFEPAHSFEGHADSFQEGFGMGLRKLVGGGSSNP